MGHSSVLKGMSWSVAEKALPQVLSLIISVILARILGLNEYRAAAVVMIFINVCDAIVTGGFGISLIQKKNADKLDYSTMSIFSVGIAFVMVIILFIVSPFIESFFEIRNLAIYLRVMSFRIPIAALNSIQRAFLQKKMEFNKIFLATLVGTLISGCVGLSMAWIGLGVWALIGQYLFNAIISTVIFFFTAKYPFGFSFSWARFVPMFRFGWKLILSALITKLYDECRALIIDKKYPDNSISFYNKGVQIPNVVVSTVNASITTVMFPVMSNAQNDMCQLRKIVKKSLMLSTYIIVPMMMGLMMVSEPLVRVLFSDEWIETVPYMQVFAISYVSIPIIELNQRAVQAIGKSGVVMGVELTNKLVGILSIVGALFFFDSPLHIAGSFGVYMLFSLIAAMTVYGVVLKYPIWNQLSDIKAALILSIIMCCVIYPLKFAIHIPILLLICQALLGALFYVAISALIKLPEFMFLWNRVTPLIKNKHLFQH